MHTPNFNTEVPSKILTPDKVPTRLGTLEFFDGSAERCHGLNPA